MAQHEKSSLENIAHQSAKEAKQREKQRKRAAHQRTKTEERAKRIRAREDKKGDKASRFASKGKKKSSQSSANRRNLWLLIMTALLVVGSIFMFTPPDERINQGLDIQGGLSVVLSAKTTTGEAITTEQMEQSRDIIERRVNALGATEATVQLQGNNQILVQIPGLSDTQEALDTIGKTGKLEFARLDSFTNASDVEAIENGQFGGGYTIALDDEGNYQLVELPTLVVTEGTYTPLITGSNISQVSVSRTEGGTDYEVDLRLDAAGTQAFAEATAELAATNGKIVIILDGEVQSAPSVQSVITGGQVSITGGYTSDQAKSLQTVLQSGSLPVSFVYEQSQVVGPTLGQEALASGVLVALIGLALVMLYLLIFYKGIGIIAMAAMAVFAVLYLGLLATLSYFNQFSLSLAGIAGIVLTIGMAADSSVLTLERFREEIRMGRSVKASSISGVHHAIVTSIDADSVTLVSALTLFFLASASVKGFGLTLALGILCDIVMMLIFKAPLIRLLAPKVIAKNPRFWGIQDSLNAVEGIEKGGRYIKKDINFMGVRKILLIIAAVCVVGSIAVCGIKGLNYGIEFVGGTSITFHQTGDVTTEDLRASFNAVGVTDATIQTTESNGESGFLVRTTTTSAEEATSYANAVAAQYGWTTSSFEVTTIAASWGASIIQSSLIAFLVSILLIIVYIAFRFEYKMGITAIASLIHDLIIVVGIYALVGREITPNTIAALLTILGYSLYDTVVVFHRINDNMQDDDVKCTFLSMANHSINEVFLRTINTTLTSLLPVLFMLFFGGETLKDFAFAMVIGLICGSYSSIAIATPLFVAWKTKEPRFAKLVKKYGDQVQIFKWNHQPYVPAVEGPQVAVDAIEVAAVQPETVKVQPESQNTNEVPESAEPIVASKPVEPTESIVTDEPEESSEAIETDETENAN